MITMGVLLEEARKQRNRRKHYKKHRPQFLRLPQNIAYQCLRDAGVTHCLHDRKQQCQSDHLRASFEKQL